MIDSFLMIQDKIILNAASLKSGICNVLQNWNRNEASHLVDFSIPPFKEANRFFETTEEYKIGKENQDNEDIEGMVIIKVSLGND